jgi:hypothetical protein
MCILPNSKSVCSLLPMSTIGLRIWWQVVTLKSAGSEPIPNGPTQSRPVLSRSRVVVVVQLHHKPLALPYLNVDPIEKPLTRADGFLIGCAFLYYWRASDFVVGVDCIETNNPAWHFAFYDKSLWTHSSAWLQLVHSKVRSSIPCASGTMRANCIGISQWGQGGSFGRDDDFWSRSAIADNSKCFATVRFGSVQRATSAAPFVTV